MSSQARVEKGLDGIVADETQISEVMPESDSLTYRGYPVDQLADRCSFEEVIHLLIDGELPARSELEELTAEERRLRPLSDLLAGVIERFPAAAHPMDALRTAVSFMGLEDERAAEPGSPPRRE